LWAGFEVDDRTSSALRTPTLRETSRRTTDLNNTIGSAIETPGFAPWRRTDESLLVWRWANRRIVVEAFWLVKLRGITSSL
jgi:hypothetical protein